MKLTVENDYGLRLVEYLARKDQVIPASELSEELNIPIRFALKILRKLNLAGITRAKRGTSGGYLLAKPIDEINFYDVIVATQGPIYINRCLASPEDCNLGRACCCGVHDQLAAIQESLIHDLKEAKFR